MRGKRILTKIDLLIQFLFLVLSFKIRILLFPNLFFFLQFVLFYIFMHGRSKERSGQKSISFMPFTKEKEIISNQSYCKILFFGYFSVLSSLRKYISILNILKIIVKKLNISLLLIDNQLLIKKI